jgi:aspartokinase
MSDRQIVSHSVSKPAMDRKADIAPSGIIVQKYGGSSLSDLAGIRRVARRVSSQVKGGKRVVVVVSAMGNTTNELLALARDVSAAPPTRELDMLVSVGERVSMALVAMAIQELGHAAVSFTGSQSGIITDQHHVAARVLEVRPTRIQKALSEGQVVVVAGFQGVSTSKEVTTLGRGGSDTTAVVLAAALGAEYCEICSDVDGIYTADPREVADAKKLPQLTVDSALALGRAGAKVLLADAVRRAGELGVRLHVSATTQASGSGTDVIPGPVAHEVIGVAADTELELVEIESAQALSDLEGAVRWSWSEEDKMIAVVDLRNLHDFEGGLENHPGLRSRGRVARVSAVGQSLVTDPSKTAAIIELLAGVSIIRWTAVGDGLSLLLPLDVSSEVLRVLHRHLIG